MSRETDLRAQLQYHNYRYHVQDSPEIADGDYDAMLLELKGLEKHNRPKDSPTQVVAPFATTGRPKVQHLSPMLSLDNAFDDLDLEGFLSSVYTTCGTEKVPLTCELKHDGLAVSLVYVDGVLTRAVTRGNGFEGEDVTENIRLVQGVPHQIVLGKDTLPETLEIRGEVQLPRAAFEAVNKHQLQIGGKPFANTRNAAAGTLRQFNRTLVVQRGLQFYAYDVGYCLGAALPNSHYDLLGLLRSAGFVAGFECVYCLDLETVKRYLEQVSAKRPVLPIDVDGVVIKVDDRSIRETIGRTAKYPNWAIAYKYPAVERTTRLKSVTYQIGRTGVITPVAELEPVEIAGVVVTRCTLHNLDEVARLGLRENCVVLVKRAGDVIPKLIRVMPPYDGVPVQYPTQCPDCGAPLERTKDQVALRCTGGWSCLAQRVGLFTHVVSRKVLDIQPFGDKLVERLVYSKVLQNLQDLFLCLDQHTLSLAGVGEKNIVKILASIEHARTMPLRKFLFMLSIPTVGEETANDVANHCGTLTQFLAVATDTEALLEIPNVGPETAKAITEYFSTFSARRLLEDLLKRGGLVVLPARNNTRHQPLLGRTVVVTGSFSGGTREYYKAQLGSMGAKVSGSVSKNTDALLAGGNAGSKLRTAQALKIPVVQSVQELLALLGS